MSPLDQQFFPLYIYTVINVSKQGSASFKATWMIKICFKSPRRKITIHINIEIYKTILLSIYLSIKKSFYISIFIQMLMMLFVDA